jgi:hypothetical protein
MKEFQVKLNSTKSEQRIELWKTHKEDIKRLFDSSIKEHDSAGSLIIFGAGNCDDLDLKFLEEYFNKIVLVDIDEKAMECGLYSQKVKEINKFQLLGIDLTGLDIIDFYNRYQSILATLPTIKAFRKFILEISYEIEKVEIPALKAFRNQFSLVASSAIVTQLFYNHAMVELTKYVSILSANNYNDMRDELIYLRNLLVTKFVKDIGATAKQGGSFIMWNDYWEGNKLQMDKLIKDIKLIPGNAVVNSNNFCRTSGFQASYIAQREFHQMVELTSDLMRCWIWKFEVDQNYVVFGLMGRIK